MGYPCDLPCGQTALFISQAKATPSKLLVRGAILIPALVVGVIWALMGGVFVAATCDRALLLEHLGISPSGRSGTATLSPFSETPESKILWE